MLDIVKWVLITLQPKRWPMETRARINKVPLRRLAVSQPVPIHPPTKFDNAKYLIRVHASISDGQDALGPPLR